MDQSDKAKQTFAYYWRHIKQYPRNVAGILLGVPITVLANVVLPTLIMANILSRLSTGKFKPGDIWGSFGWELVAFAFLELSGILCWRFVDWHSWQIEARVQQDMAHEIFNSMLVKSASFHANNFGGSLVSNASKVFGSYYRVTDSMTYQVLPLISSLLLAVIILGSQAPLFAALLVLFAIIFVFVSFKVSVPARQSSREHSAAESRQTGFLADAITNVMVIKSFARGRYERRRFKTATDETRRLLFKTARKHAFQFNVLGFMTRTISIASVVSAVISVMVFHANIGTVFLILTYTMSIVDGLFAFGNQTLRNFNRAIGDTSEMIMTLAEPPEVVDPIRPEKSHIKTGDIKFKEVTFQHDGSDDAIFDKLNLHIRHGEKVGLVGHSGSGKTTFTRILLRFSDIDGGEILIDGQNIARITQDDLHKQIAYVPQEPMLFHRSIAENISYGNPKASAKDIEKIARQAHAHEFIATLPAGYDTLVGERGVKLSGGQRQRVAIARAMLKDAPVLVLGAWHGERDSESEVLIQDALWKLMENRTAIVIAHRLSTIQHMDRIIVLDNGRIAEQGNHKQLVKARGTYAKLWAHQSGGFIEE
jgi:ATP-binding cassette subfamily B protein